MSLPPPAAKPAAPEMATGHDDPVTQRWLERVGGIRTWVRDGQRAPHKPLLLL